MTTKKVALAAAVSAALALPGIASAQPGEIEWFGNVYAKFLDGNRSRQASVYNSAETTPGESGGDQGQGIEFELLFRNQVSKQVEIGGRLKARFNKNFWTNFGGFGPDEQDERSAQYVKMRGVYAIITPGYAWIDSATIGSNDFGMFDPLTQGKYRYIDRDNASGLLFQGSFGGNFRWDVARVSLPSLFAGPRFVTTRGNQNDPNTEYEAGDGAWSGQLRWGISPQANATGLITYVRDKEIETDEFCDPNLDPDDPGQTCDTENTLDGSNVVNRYDNFVAGIKGEYTGLGPVDLRGSLYYSDYNFTPVECDGDYNGNCRFSPALNEEADDLAWFLNIDVADFLVSDLTFDIQVFNIGEDYLSIQSARRESDVLLSEGWMNTWQWGRPDYNFGVRNNGNAGAGVGFGGFNGETQQVVSLMADNDFTDFDEPVAYTVNGYKGITVIPRYTWGDIEFQAEYSYYDYNTNWQSCDGNLANNYRENCFKYPRNEGTHSWGLGGDFRSPFAAYQERDTQIFAFRADYTLNWLNGFDLTARFKFIDDEDDRVDRQDQLTVAYDGYVGGIVNPDWVPNVGLDRDGSGGCLNCDDRDAEYRRIGFDIGYQIHPDLYVKLIYDHWDVDMFDGTIDVAPVGMGFEGSNEFGWIEYTTGDWDKDRIGVEANYFLSGVEFGLAADWFWGDYDPEFYVDSGGRSVRLNPAGDTVTTPLGNIRTDSDFYDYEQYRLKAFMKVSF